MFEALPPASSDALMKIINLFASDARPNKLDLGIGTYRDDEGRTPILSAVKQAEQILVDTQDSKTYLGPAGDLRFVDSLRSLVLPQSLAAESRVTAIQTPGGTGAIRIATELVRLANPGATVYLGVPTWPNHEPIVRAVGLRVLTYLHAEAASNSVNLNEMLSVISGARAGDVVLLHACCHNPTGMDLSCEQWREVAELIRRRRLIPFLDLAYQGMGRGLADDLEGMHMVLAAAEEALIAVSCSKTFGLYRDRTGMLVLLARSSEAASTALSQLMSFARTAYSMPPDHGAAVVRTILNDPNLRMEWQTELTGMRERVNRVRAELHAETQSRGLDLAGIASGLGMFAMLPLAVEDIVRLREHGIYVAETGRINIAGLRAGDAERLVDAVCKLTQVVRK